jgi:hypothetical protein
MSTETIGQEPAALERLIHQVRGVNAVRLVADQGGKIDEVHVVGEPGRAPKAIVRDIESILYVRGGVRVDHRKISLVQIADVATPHVAPRLQLLDVRQSAAGDETSVHVTLALRDRQVEGVGTPRPGQSIELPMLAAYATIHGLDSLFGPRGRVHLEQLQRQTFGALEVYLAHLAHDADGVAEILLGISVLRDDELTAVAKAVLDAVNRRVERLLADAPAPPPR